MPVFYGAKGERSDEDRLLVGEVEEETRGRDDGRAGDVRPLLREDRTAIWGKARGTVIEMDVREV